MTGRLAGDITLNLGLRYEWESGPYDDNDIFSRYLDLSAPNAADAAESAGDPGGPGGPVPAEIQRRLGVYR